MKDFAERIAKLSPQKLALLAIDLQRRIEARDEPVAVVGIGCRFPGGVHDGDSFWRLLEEGRSAIGPVPESRWPAAAWRAADLPTPDCGLLDQIDRFDPLFFGLSPREAASLDPQQRLLMEVAWEALEDAAIAPDRLGGSRTGVFIGLSTHDYAQLSLGDAPAAMDAYTLTGGSHAVAAGRLSYVLGLQGPSLAVDTSCSSSLTAVHLACQSLRAGECDLALAGGVNVILSPVTSSVLAKSGLLALDGRCKFGDGAADGYVRGEGCGIVVLKTLSAACAAHDPILALIRSTAVNQDGRSSGLTVPNGPAQAALIRQALAQAGVEPHEIGCVEAHGTGTALGDPIELQALGSVLGKGRATPLRVGSIKTNLGHLEAAAGIAGLIKLVLALRRGMIPPTLNVTQPTGHVDWPALGIRLARKIEPWPGARRVGGVSSFGFSGTNVHAILEAYETSFAVPPPGGTNANDPGLFVLSARDEKALRELAGMWAEKLSGAAAPPLDEVCRTAALGRAHFGRRLACVVSDRGDLCRRLRAFAFGAGAEGLFAGEARGPVPPSVAFDFAPDCAPPLREQITGRWRDWGVRPGGGDQNCLRLELNAASAGREPMLQSAARLFVSGVPLDWAAIAGSGARAPSMPTYPFQRERYWIESIRPPLPEAWGPSRPAQAAPAPDLDECLYDVEWREQPAAAAAPAAPAFSLAAAAERLGLHLSEIHDENRLELYDALQPEIDRVCVGYILRAFRKLGWSPAAGQPFTHARFVAELGIVPAQHRLVERLLNVLVQDGVLAGEEGTYRFVAEPADSDPDATLAGMKERYGAFSAELTLLGRCAPFVAEVLRGQCDALSLIFPGGDMKIAEHLYQEAPTAHAFNQLLGRAVEELVGGFPAGRPMRILEIGAGTGGTTAHVIGRLPAGRVRYTYTDISPMFIEWGAEKFKDCPFIEYRPLDIGRDPAAQGFAARSYDIVIAANVLHATPDLRKTLARTRELLAPGGALVLLECVLPQRYGDLTFGMTEGWWAFADRDLRPDSQFIDAVRWPWLLENAGFEDPRILPGESAAASSVAFAQQRVILARAPRASRAGNWLVLPDRSGVAEALAGVLRSRGESCTLAGPQDSALGPQHSFTGIVDCRALDAPPLEALDAPALMELQQAMLGRVVAVMRGLMSAPGGAQPRLWLATRGACGFHVSAPEQATVYGVARVIAMENPEFACTHVDLDPAASASENASALAGELDPSSAESQVACRAGVRRVARMRRARLASGGAPLIRPDGAYLIAGGLGGLGLVTAAWLVERGARQLALLGRRAPTPQAQARIEDLERSGAHVLAMACDVTRAEPLRRALERIEAEAGPLRGVIHSACVLDDAVIARMDPGRIERVLAPKVAGAWNLHRLTQGLALDHFVLYSSGASLVGTAGQANYVAANAFLDALAHWRRGRGLPGLSVNWGPWTEVGFAAGRTFGRAIATISIEQGFAALDRLFAGAPPQVGVLPIQWPELLASLKQWPRGIPPFYEEFTATPGTEAAPAPPEGLSRETFGAASPDERRRLLVEFLGRELGEVLGFGRAIEPRRSILELGFDSLMAVKLRARINSRLGLTIPLKRLLDGPSAELIAARLLETAGDPAGAPRAPTAGAPTRWVGGAV